MRITRHHHLHGGHWAFNSLTGLDGTKPPRNSGLNANAPLLQLKAPKGPQVSLFRLEASVLADGSLPKAYELRAGPQMGLLVGDNALLCSFNADTVTSVPSRRLKKP